ncbi:hypothetical protein HPB49_019650 [Dermacentor silvarum]|uniref:Uncharacterized protein n=1 Tax=Dermacentor silvarum TaxID=543639 RepID=A0ACB8CB07_DERSI|nr:hypothetical protein HPB49_019650 [Dermacentor silvarum]
MFMFLVQKQTKQQLLKALSSLPTPKNDYEIVVPEEDPSAQEPSAPDIFVEDQADRDAAKEQQRLEKLEAERKLQSQAVQRSLPRPLDVNASVLRPAHTEPPLTDLQKAEELIKQEMLVMQHYDALHNPTEAQQSGRKGSANVTDEAAHLAYLERHPYHKYNQEELALPTDHGIIEIMRKLYCKSLLQCMLVAYDANTGYDINLLGAIHLLNHSWKELAPAKIANCFVHAGFSLPHLGEPDDDQVCNDLYEAVHRIVGEEVKGNFDSFALADTDGPIVAPATDAEIVDLVLGDPGGDEEPIDKQPWDIPTVA